MLVQFARTCLLGVSRGFWLDADVAGLVSAAGASSPVASLPRKHVLAFLFAHAAIAGAVQKAIAVSVDSYVEELERVGSGKKPN